MHPLTTFVINWHLSEACNYGCRYCYAEWDETASSCELIGDPKRTQALLAELFNFFEPGNTAGSIRLGVSVTRLMQIV
jgi:radical S-adenosyl methionine domain-containing protein 2